MNDNYDLSKLRKKPKRKNSRTKGNTFERQIAKLLNDRFKTEEFSRSPGSGAFATTHTLPEHLKIYGDLITPQKFKFCIECKKGYNNQNLYSLYNYSSDIWKFVEQCEKDSGKCSRLPMVIFKQDRQPTLAIVPYDVEFGQDLKYIEVMKQKKYRIYLFDDLVKCWDHCWFDA
jgi:Holliday junction resolvase